MNGFEALCPGCGVCKEACPFLAEYGSPDLILRERPETVFSCTSCRRCDGMCPRGLAPSAAFFQEKQRLVRQDAIAPPVRRALDGARRFARAGHWFPFSFYQDEDTVFWPGCGLAAHRPGLVRRVRNILGRQLNRRVGLALDCCFDPVYSLGDTEMALAALRTIGRRLREHGVRQVITGCLNCHKLLSEHLAGIQVDFVLEVLPPEVFEKKQTGAIYLHHPCPSSRWEAIRKRVRKAVTRIDPSPGTDCGPFPLSEAPAGQCCGSGGGVSALHPGLADRFLDRITGEAAGGTMVTYCTGCQDRFLMRGVEAVHLLECLPGVTPRRRLLPPYAQWANRFSLAMTERLGRGNYRTTEPQRKIPDPGGRKHP